MFLVAVLFLSYVIASLDHLGEPERATSATFYLIVYFLGAETLLPPQAAPLGSPSSVIIAGFLRVVLQALLLGTIVFKLLVPQQLYTFRRRLLVRRDKNGCWQAVVRLYNSTRLEVVDLTFETFLRTPMMKNLDTLPTGNRRNELETLAPFVKNTKIEIQEPKKEWPISITYIPYSLAIPLNDADVCYYRGKPVLRSLQGATVTPQGIDRYRGQSFLTVILRGHIPSLATDLVETHWFQLSGGTQRQIECEFGTFHDVYVVPGSHPKRAGGKPHSWLGWKEFENVRPVEALRGRQWIFGYGSLVDVEHLSSYLAEHGFKLGNYEHRNLPGFKRIWNVAMDNKRTLPRYKYYLDPKTKTRPDVFVTFANIEKQDNGCVPGILFEVDDEMLKVFDSRELNYWRTDVTAHFSEPVDGTVWTYIGSPEANARFQQGLRERALVIDMTYAQRIETAFTRAGLSYAAELPRDVPLVELTKVDT